MPLCIAKKRQAVYESRKMAHGPELFRAKSSGIPRVSAESMGRGNAGAKGLAERPRLDPVAGSDWRVRDMAEVLEGAASETTERPVKDLYEVGEIPPLGHVPGKMHAWVIRRERHGEPEEAMQVEVVDTPALDSHDVLVMVMAAGVNYNGVWAGLGVPISPFDVHKAPYHIAGSDASGIVWAVGSQVKRWKVGDEVVVHCNQDDGDDEECNGGDPMFSPSQRIWGYETPDGSFAQFCRVQD